MNIELLYAPGCTQCDAVRSELKAVAKQACADVPWVWTELNVLEHLDYAVALGVLTLPAIAIDGALVFATLPAPRALLAELSHRSQRNPA
ncbi:MAG: thioredoxin family protein [Gammaproteobacteria bacterium]|nr:thioredoxin family protein [Gammaproteobacteria bacterium]